MITTRLRQYFQYNTAKEKQRDFNKFIRKKVNEINNFRRSMRIGGFAVH